jgi:hypothetical protein
VKALTVSRPKTPPDPLDQIDIPEV